jgi:putative transposase
MLIAERFLNSLISQYGKHTVSTDGVVRGILFKLVNLRLKHQIHLSNQKSIIERTIQYIKDRTECFDDYFPCRREKCKLKHIMNWFNLFTDYHNKEVIT